MRDLIKRLASGVALAVLVTACGGGGGSGSGGGGGDPPAPVPLASAISSLESSGALPVLDRTPSLAGTDSDSDGVRDDVGAYITSLSDTEIQKSVLRRLAKDFASAVQLGTGSPASATLRDLANEFSAVLHCLRIVYASDLAELRLAKIRAVSLNTLARFNAYVMFGSRAAGLVTRTPSTTTCDPAPATATPPSLCENRGYLVGFFNGVWNMPGIDGADAGKAALQSILGNTFNGEPVKYETFYNHTGSTVDATFLQDIAETFIQRANEIDNTGALSSRFEFLWEVLTDDSTGFWDTLIGAAPAAAVLLDALYQDFTSKVAAGYSLLLSNPPTISDYAEHRSRLDEFVLQGQKILLVAHSQGNLFVNSAYDYIAAKAKPGSVAVVHIAPASPTLRGSYVLSDTDVVINALRVQGLGSVPASNLDCPVSRADLSGHKLIETYLDPLRPARARVTGLLVSGMASLVTPPADANSGFFTVTLTWNGSGDVDLHTFEPGGAHVYYSAKAGLAGSLDVDNVTANGPEHYYASCDSAKLRLGTYTFGINNYNGATGRTATIQAASVRDGVLLTRTLDVGPQKGSSGNSSPIIVFTVTVSKDASDNYTATAN